MVAMAFTLLHQDLIPEENSNAVLFIEVLLPKLMIHK